MAKQPAKVLLVEDDPNDVELILSACREEPRKRRRVVRDGEQALEYLFRQGAYESREAGNPAMVLLDLKLPKVDGFEVLRRLKADPHLRTIPVAVLTSSREEQDLLRSYESGTNAYVVKTVNFRDFVEAVAELGFSGPCPTTRPQQGPAGAPRAREPA